MTFRIKEARQRANLTQKALAEMIGVKPPTLNGYEKGHHDPKSDILEKIADICGVTVDFLLGREDEQENPPAPAEPEQGEDATDEEKEAIDKLIAAGLIKEGVQLSDADLKFLSHISTIVDMWLDQR